MPAEEKVTEQLELAAIPPAGAIASQTALPSEFSDALLSDSNIALFHTSFRKPLKDAEFGAKMYQIEVIVIGPDAALD